MPSHEDGLRLVPGETGTVSVAGRAPLRAATLTVTRYRVAVAPLGRNAHVRWIPLEEIVDIVVTRRFAPGLVIESAVETIAFCPAGEQVDDLVTLLRAEQHEARVHGRRHHPEVIQAWLDRIHPDGERPLRRLSDGVRRTAIRRTLVG